MSRHESSVNPPVASCRRCFRLGMPSGMSDRGGDTNDASHGRGGSGGVQKLATAHLTDETTRRDLFGVVRGRCTRVRSAAMEKRARRSGLDATRRFVSPHWQCPCLEFSKRTAQYTAAPGARHPDNDVTVTHCTSCGCPPDAHERCEAETCRAEGNDAWERHAFAEAALHYTKALRHRKGDAALYSNRAACYLALRQFSQALSDAQHAVAIEPTWAKARARVGTAHTGLQQHEAASRAYGMALRLDPGNRSYERLLADAKRAASTSARGKQPRATTAPDAARVPDPMPPTSVSSVDASNAAAERAPQPSVRNAGLTQAAAALDAALALAMEAHSELQAAACRKVVALRWQGAALRVRCRLAEERRSQCCASTRAALQQMRCEGQLLRQEIEELTCQRDTLAADICDSATLDSDGVHSQQPDDSACSDAPHSDDNDTSSEASSEVMDDDVCDDWAASWEAEQFEAAAMPPSTPASRRRRSSQATLRTASGSLTAAALSSLLHASGHSAAADGLLRDAADTPRGACTHRQCLAGGCNSFVPFTNGSALSPDTPLAAHLALLASAPRTRCAACGCVAEDHETAAQAAARQRTEAERARRAAERADTAAAQRRRRVQAAEQRASESVDAQDATEVLQRTSADSITGAERGACASCTACPGFEVWYRTRDCGDPNVMFFCSRCGCDASAHAISAAWQRSKEQEERRRAAEAAAARQRARDASAAHGAGRRDADAAERRQHLAALGLGPTATQAQAGKAYRRLALKYHPDKQAWQGDAKKKAHAAAQWQAVSAAWRGLQAMCGQP